MYKLEMRESLRAWLLHCTPSKVLQMHSFHIVQKRRGETVLQAFLLFLPKKLPFQLVNKSITANRRTHVMSNKENSKCVCVYIYIYIRIAL